MTKPGLAGIFLFLAALLPPQGVLAEPAKGPQAEIVQKIESAYEKVQDIEAGFTQKILFKDFATPFISKGEVYIQKVTLHESNGNRSIFDFSEIRVDQGLKDPVFTFTIPKGVEVVEQPPLP